MYSPVTVTPSKPMLTSKFWNSPVPGSMARSGAPSPRGARAVSRHARRRLAVADAPELVAVLGRLAERYQRASDASRVTP